MSKLLSFLGGAGKGVLQGIEKAETNAKEEAMLRIKQLSENFEKVREENTKLTNNLKAEEDWIRQTYKDATPEQIAFLQSSPAALSSLKKMEDPTKINLATVINFASTGDANSVIADKIQVFPKMEKAITEPIRKAMPAYRSALAGFYDEFGEQAGKTAEMRYARATGVDVQTMEAMKPLSRPTSDGKFDMAKVMEKTPKNAKDITDKLEVERVQALQKFGKNSKEVADITGQINEITSLDATADKTNEARANRLMLAIQDTKDPEQVKDLQSQLKTTQAAIKQHKEVTSTKSASELKDVYSKMKTSVNDFVNNRMRNDSGFSWNKYYDFKTFTDPATGETITSRTQKAELKPEEQKVVFEKERQIMMSALKTNGYVLNDGAPRSVVAQEFMNNFNIRAADLASNTPSPTPTATETAPAAATPAAIPTAQPTSNKIPAPKTQADYDAIPPNTEYMDTDGKIKRKGGK